MKPGSQTVITTFVVFFVLSSLALIIYLGTNVKNVSPLPPTSDQAQTLSQPKESKVYQTDNFSFNYPNTYNIEKEDAEEVLFSDSTKATFFVLRSANSLPAPKTGTTFTISSHLNKSVKIADIEEKQITVNNRELNWSTIDCSVDCYFHLVKFNTNGLDYQLIANGAGGGLEQEFKKIAETMKFF